MIVSTCDQNIAAKNCVNFFGNHLISIFLFRDFYSYFVVNILFQDFYSSFVMRYLVYFLSHI